MMIKMLNNAISAIEQGEEGYEINRSHYDGYRGMQKIVDRLAAKGLVQLFEVVGTGTMLLVPTPQAYEVVQTPAASVLRAA
jgi:hypothetical protein